jgi:hypothetical protein
MITKKENKGDNDDEDEEEEEDFEDDEDKKLCFWESIVSYNKYIFLAIIYNVIIVTFIFKQVSKV